MTKSDACAEHDGIKREWRNGHKVYFIPCSSCGCIMERKQYASDKVYLCGYCKLSVDQKRKAEQLAVLTSGKSRKEVMFDKAVDELAEQVKDMSAYGKAIAYAKTRVERYGSIPEAMVAIELLRLRYAIIPQQKVGKYKVDFAIPSIKLIVEVDGERYHDGIDLVRDAYIKLRLGSDWRIVHIPAELIRKRIRTLKAVIDNAV